MKMHIVGIKAMEGVSKKTGKPFDAFVLSCTLVTDQVDAGCGVKELFLDKGLLMDAARSFGGYKALVEMDIDVQYNDRGFPVGAEILV